MMLAENQPQGEPLNSLTPAHYAMLHDKSAISDAVIRERGYQTLTNPPDLLSLGFAKMQARTAPALVIPLWNVSGQQTGWQIRPDRPRQGRDGKLIKYEMAKGSRISLDVHPRAQPHMMNPAIPVWITEGIRKG